MSSARTGSLHGGEGERLHNLLEGIYRTGTLCERKSNSTENFFLGIVLSFLQLFFRFFVFLFLCCVALCVCFFFVRCTACVFAYLPRQMRCAHVILVFSSTWGRSSHRVGRFYTPPSPASSSHSFLPLRVSRWRNLCNIVRHTRKRLLEGERGFVQGTILPLERGHPRGGHSWSWFVVRRFFLGLGVDCGRVL